MAGRNFLAPTGWSRQFFTASALAAALFTGVMNVSCKTPSACSAAGLDRLFQKNLQAEGRDSKLAKQLCQASITNTTLFFERAAAHRSSFLLWLDLLPGTVFKNIPAQPGGNHRAAVSIEALKRRMIRAFQNYMDADGAYYFLAEHAQALLKEFGGEAAADAAGEPAAEQPGRGW